jgi:hypothetical protein
MCAIEMVTSKLLFPKDTNDYASLVGMPIGMPVGSDVVTCALSLF